LRKTTAGKGRNPALKLYSTSLALAESRLETLRSFRIRKQGARGNEE